MKLMEIFEIQDKYNSSKVWVIKKTKCRHYYMNQKICGKMFYKGFQKTTLKHINAIGLNLKDCVKKVEVK
jgi:hypothetical protein